VLEFKLISGQRKQQFSIFNIFIHISINVHYRHYTVGTVLWMIVLRIGEIDIFALIIDDHFGLTLFRSHLGAAPIAYGSVAFIAHKRIPVDNHFGLATLAGYEDQIFNLLTHSGWVNGRFWDRWFFGGCKTRNEKDSISIDWILETGSVGWVINLLHRK
jgi:hypothetical protein